MCIFSQLFIVFFISRTPCMTKTHFEYGYLCIWIKRLQKVPSSEGKLLHRSTKLIEVKYLHFYPIIYCILHWKKISALLDPLSLHFQFLGHPVWLKHILNKLIFVFGSKGSQKAPA